MVALLTASAQVYLIPVHVHGQLIYPVGAPIATSKTLRPRPEPSSPVYEMVNLANSAVLPIKLACEHLPSHLAYPDPAPVVQVSGGFVIKNGTGRPGGMVAGRVGIQVLRSPFRNEVFTNQALQLHHNGCLAAMIP